LEGIVDSKVEESISEALEISETLKNGKKSMLFVADA